MIKRIFSFVFVIAAVSSLYAQQHNPCLTDHVTDEFFRNNPAQAEQLKQQFYSNLEQYRQAPAAMQRKSGAKRIIPVVFHVIHTYGPENISKDQILDQIRVLNEDFSRMNADKTNTRALFAGDAADCEIEFRLATKDPNGNCTDGITRTYSTLTVETRDEIKNLIKWDNKKYLNVWVVKSIRPLTADQTGTTLGFAYLPWSLPGTNNVDGVVVRADYIGTIGTSSPSKAGRVLTHEIGHYLGLSHPFENGCGTTNCGNTGDRVCDTPPVSSPSFGCDWNRNSCTNDNPDRPDQIENFMDYADGNCQNMFSWDQKTIIDLVLNSGAYRQTLISGANLIATGTDNIITPNCAPKADFSTTVRTICAGNSITFTDESWGGTVTSRTWTFNGANPSTSSDANPSVIYNTPGTYNVNLTVGNSAGQNQVTRSQIVVVMPGVATIKAPVTEGFENTTYPPAGWSASNNTGTSKTWERTTTAHATGSASIRAVINAATPVDESYSITLPAINLGPMADDAKLNFKAAYTIRTGVTSDKLRIFYSTDCGNNWILLSQRTSTFLTSAPNYTGASFVPADASQWRDISLSLGTLNSRNNVIFRFEAISNGGNSIYLDDINISSNAATTVETFSKQDMDMKVYPNPSNGTSYLSFNLIEQADVDVKVYDVAGRLVKDLGRNNSTAAGTQIYSISKTGDNLSNGIYFVKILINNSLYTEKLILTE